MPESQAEKDAIRWVVFCATYPGEENLFDNRSTGELRSMNSRAAGVADALWVAGARITSPADQPEQEWTEGDRLDVSAWLIREADQRVKFFPQRRDGVDALMRHLASELVSPRGARPSDGRIVSGRVSGRVAEFDQRCRYGGIGLPSCLAGTRGEEWWCRACVTKKWTDWLASINYGVDYGAIGGVEPPCTLEELARAYVRVHGEEDAETWAWCIEQETGVLTTPPHRPAPRHEPPDRPHRTPGPQRADPGRRLWRLHRGGGRGDGAGRVGWGCDVVSLSPEDREALADFECECDLASRCSCDAEMVTAVEAIVARHVAAALTEAADAAQREADRLVREADLPHNHAGAMYEAARIVRAAIKTT